MDGDDLNRPLGLDRELPYKVRDIPWGALALGGIGVLGVGMFVFSRMTDPSAGGEPFAVASIDRPAPVAAPVLAPPVSAPTAAAAAQPAGARAPDDGSEMEHGVRVFRSGGGGAPSGALIIQVPEALGLQMAPAPDKRLVDKGPYGPLPKIGADGARPLQVYARPLPAATKLPANAPRIAIVIGGMGISQTATDHAIETLPGAVTLAFAPYGTDVGSLAAKARARGHELLLQVPMEPFDPGQTPGPRTLQTGFGADQNLDHLHWAMSRFQGYVGITNYMGAKFTALDASLVPIEREVARRGLLWLDDGSSARSVAGDVGGDLGLNFLQAQVSLEGMSREAAEAALVRVEKQAREKGSAIVVATGLPASVDRLADFAQGLERKGMALVPLSALADAAERRTAGTGPAE
jgi:polysaccharide deacetylase 2 family uncharacterized protein YibQ